MQTPADVTDAWLSATTGVPVWVVSLCIVCGFVNVGMRFVRQAVKRL